MKPFIFSNRMRVIVSMIIISFIYEDIRDGNTVLLLFVDAIVFILNLLMIYYTIEEDKIV